MVQTVTVELRDEIYKYFCEMAGKAGQSPEEWVRERLEAIVPGNVFMTPKERAKALADLMKHAGVVDLGYPTGTDNEEIDRDLAEEYASTHEDET